MGSIVELQLRISLVHLKGDTISPGWLVMVWEQLDDELHRQDLTRVVVKTPTIFVVLAPRSLFQPYDRCFRLDLSSI